MILVDDARWAWRGELWAHLVSDASYDELHEFAAALGLRRLSFQGDHYDVPEPLRCEAIERGATPVSGRDIVTRLRRAGLRRPGGAVRWTRVWWLEPPGPFDATAARAATAALARYSTAATLRHVIAAIGHHAVTLRRPGAHVLTRPGEAAFAVDAAGAAPTAVREIVLPCHVVERDSGFTFELVVPAR